MIMHEHFHGDFMKKIVACRIRTHDSPPNFFMPEDMQFSNQSLYPYGSHWPGGGDQRAATKITYMATVNIIYSLYA